MYKILANTLFLGKEVVYMPTCHSTNDIALELVSHTDKNEGLIVITDEQKSGKGQRGNVWISEKAKNLTFSLLLKPTFLAASQQFYLNMMVSLAVLETIKPLVPGRNVHVKWPNDVLIDKKKVCGILIENSLNGMQITSSVIGIGLNVNQEEIGFPQAAGIIDFTGEELDRTAILEQLVLHVEQLYMRLKTNDFNAIKTRYLENLYGFKSPVKLYSVEEFFGEILDLDDHGRVIIAKNGETEVFDFKELRFILP